jgi:hypothetical protein
MRPKPWVIVALLILGGQCSAPAEDRELRCFTNYHDEKFYQTVVRQSDLDRAPRWDAGEARPPLRARRAMFAAREHVAKLIPGSGMWPIHTVSLEPVGALEQWIYVVEFTRIPLEGIGSLSGPFRVVVLMDGTIIQPKIAPVQPSKSRSKLDS